MAHFIGKRGSTKSSAVEPDLSVSLLAAGRGLTVDVTAVLQDSSSLFRADYVGTAGNDTYLGTSSDDSVLGNEGDDALYGAGGNDTIYGNTGNDLINGGEGDDILEGGAGADSYDGGAGYDIISQLDFRGLAADLRFDLTATSGDNYSLANGTVISRVELVRTLYTGGGDDTLSLTGDQQAIVWHGEAGNDLLVARFDGSSEAITMGLHPLGVPNWFYIERPSYNNLDPLVIGFQDKAWFENVERVDITGSSGNDTLRGFNGNDRLAGGDGDDVLEIGLGSDTYEGGAGYDTVTRLDFNGSTAHLAFDLTSMSDDIYNLATGTVITGVEFVRNLSTGIGDDTLWLNGDQQAVIWHGGDGGDLLVASYNGSSEAIKMGLHPTAGGWFYIARPSYYNPDSEVASDPNKAWFNAIERIDITGSSGNDTLIGLGGADTIHGGAGNDHIIANGAIYGGDGNDLIEMHQADYGWNINLIGYVDGGAGDDQLHAYAGNDQVLGGDGNDYLNAGLGDDTVSGGADNDTVDGLDGADVVHGEGGYDLLRGGIGYDRVVAGDGADTVSGGEDGDAVWGQAGDDMLQGDAGNDRLYGGAGNDTLEGGSSSGIADIAEFLTTNGLTYNPETGSFYKLVATLPPGADNWLADDAAAAAMIMNGVSGHLIRVDNAAENAWLRLVQLADPVLDKYIWIGATDREQEGQWTWWDGGVATDLFWNGTAVDGLFSAWSPGQPDNGNTPENHENSAHTYVDGLWNDLIETGEHGYYSSFFMVEWEAGAIFGNLLEGGAGADQLEGGDQIDTASYVTSRAGVTVNLPAGSGSGGDADGDTLTGIENLLGSSFGDHFTGAGAANWLSGGEGNDTLDGGAGGDQLIGGDQVDMASYVNSSGGVTVNLVTGSGSGGDAEGDVLTGVENLLGSALDDHLTGNGVANLLSGGAGVDRIVAGDGADTVTGGDGADAAWGQTGNDLLQGEAGNDRLYGGKGDDTLEGGSSSPPVDIAGLVATNGLIYNPETGSFYKRVISSGNWLTDNAAAAAMVMNGVSGHLIRIDGLAENAWLEAVAADNLTWIGASDKDVEGQWQWWDGGVATDLFWNGGAVESLFSAWSPGQPNDYGTGEDAAHIWSDGLWNDLFHGSGPDAFPSYFMVEWEAGAIFGNLLEGGAGADQLVGGGRIDTATYVTSSGGINVDLITGAGYNHDAEGDVLSGIENLLGSTFDDHLTGNGVANWLSGGEGNDTLIGGAETDSLDGGNDNDVLEGGAGDDTLAGGSGEDTAVFSGPRSSYSVHVDEFGVLTVRDFRASGDGVDRLTGIETLLFADTYVAPPWPTVPQTDPREILDAIDDSEYDVGLIPVELPVLVNDIGNNRHITDFTQGASGSVSLLGDMLIYTARADHGDTDTFTYTIRGNGIQTDTAIVTINLNKKPTAVDDVYSGVGSNSVELLVLSNDVDPEGRALTIIGASSGKVTNLGDKLIYTPGTAHGTTDTFSYTIKDDKNQTSTANVTINFAIVNRPPVAVSDTYNDVGDGLVYMPVLENDYDPDGDPLSIVAYSEVKAGILTQNGDQFVYALTSDEATTDKFSYTISDGNGHESTAWVTLNLNLAPTARNDEVNHVGNDPIEISVLSNDDDREGDILAITNVTQGNFGEAVISGDKLIYTPNKVHGPTDTFQYTITDGHGHTSSATVRVNFDEAPPVAGTDVYWKHGETYIPIEMVMANDYDPNGDPISITGIAGAWKGGVFHPGGNGLATLEGGVIHVNPGNFEGDVVVEYILSDGHSTSPGIINVHFGNTIVDIPNTDRSVSPGATARVELYETLLSAQEQDNEHDSYSIVSVFAYNGEASFSGNVINFTAGNKEGDGYVQYKYTDGYDKAEAVIHFHIDNVFTPVADKSGSVREHQSTTISLQDVLEAAHQSDPEGDAYVITGIISVEGNGGASLSGTDVNVSAGERGSIKIQYGYSDGFHDGVGIVNVSVTRQPGKEADSNGDPHLRTFDGLAYDFQAAGEFTLVKSENLEIQVRQEPWPFNQGVTVNTAVAMKIGDAVVGIYLNQGEDAVLYVNGSVSILQTGELKVFGDATISRNGNAYSISDNLGNTFTVFDYDSYLNVGTFIIEDELSSVIGLLGDADGLAGNDLALRDGTVLTGPVAADVLYGDFADSWRINDATSLFVYQNGESTATYTNRDFPLHLVTLDQLTPAQLDAARVIVEAAGLLPGTVDYDNAILDVALTGDENFAQVVERQEAPPPEVLVINAAPITADDAAETLEDTQITIDVLANDTDPEGQALTIVNAYDPNGGTVAVAENGQLIYTPSANFFGIATIFYTVSDGSENRREGRVQVLVTAVNDGPTGATEGALPAGIEDHAYRLTDGLLLTGISDADGDGLQILGLAVDHGTLFVTGDGLWSLVPPLGFAGKVTLSFTVSDDHGGALAVIRSVDLAAFNHVISGTPSADTLTGSLGADTINGLAGNDRLDAAGGNDLIDGGAGGDRMLGGLGDDTYYVDNAGDSVGENHLEGTDTIVSSVSYSLVGRAVEILTLTGTADLKATGNSLANRITGNSGDNVIDGGAGGDRMLGGLGDDTYYVDNAGDSVGENHLQGTDTIVSSVSYSLVGRAVEILTLTGTADLTATGNSLANRITGNSGDNVIDGGAGADRMLGGLGDDTYYVNNAGDSVGENHLEGTDTIISSVSYSLFGRAVEVLTLTGTNNLNATGNSLNNTLKGNAGNNLLDGGAGADTMVGALGDDTYYVDNIGDNVQELHLQGTDTVISSVTYSFFGRAAEILTLTGSSDIDATGNSLANTLTGNAGKNRLDGAGGNDTLAGGLGADLFVFLAGSGKDTMTDFSAVQNDMIDIHAYTHGITNAGMVTQMGNNVVINLGSGNIVTVLDTGQADVLAHLTW